jgi:hypothetical protein
MNSYMNMTLWIYGVWIHVYEFREYYEFIYEYNTMNSCFLNSCIWIQRMLWIHMHEFKDHEFIVSYSYTNSYYMNSKCHIHIWIHENFEFIYGYHTMNSYAMNSSKDSYMNSKTMNS